MHGAGVEVTGLKKNELVGKWKDVLQSGADAPTMEGWLVEEEEEELNKLTNQEVTMGDTALARHQYLIERQTGNIIKNMSKENRDELKQKLERRQMTHIIIWILCLCHPLLKFFSHRTTWRKPKEKKTIQFMRRRCRLIK